MTEQLTIFDALLANKLKEIGITQAQYSSVAATTWVEQARQVALVLAAKNGSVTINDVYRLCPRPADISVNASGAVFRDKRFTLLRYEKSDKVSARARRIAVWGPA